MKRKSPRPSTNQAAPPVTTRKNIGTSKRSFGLVGTGTHSNQKTKFHRWAVAKEKKKRMHFNTMLDFFHMSTQ